MSKELLLVFVYDSQMCLREEDNPDDAITFFHPTWVNMKQRHALCSQLMGIVQFFQSSFSIPKIISLQSGKFSMKQIGRYYLFVGTDRNIPDVILETRSKTLYKLIKLFHYDIEMINKNLLLSQVDLDDYALSDKLSEIFQVYLPILQYATNIFGNIPMFKLPKSISNLFLDANVILENCQNIDGVLGGIILYQNKVICTQLSCDITKQFVVTDPYRIKLPADRIITPFHLPVGVQLLKIYINKSEVNTLRKHDEELRLSFNKILDWREENLKFNKTSNKTKDVINCTTPIANFINLKRDMSAMLTVPEETECKTSPANDVPDLVKDAVRARNLMRVFNLNINNYILKINEENFNKSKTTDDINSENHIQVRYNSFPENTYEISNNSTDKINFNSYYNTITDPKYPLFKKNGFPLSKVFQKNHLANKSNDLLECIKQLPKNEYVKRPQNIEISKKEQLLKESKSKRNFSLPLNSGIERSKLSKEIPLTPLMAKLTMLAQEECSDLATSSKVTKTPTFSNKKSFEFSVFKTNDNNSNEKPLEEILNKDINTVKEKADELTEIENDELYAAVLFVFGNNNSSLLLILENSAAQDPDSIHSLWEIGMKDLTEYETRLKKCLELWTSNASLTSSAVNSQSTDYSWALVEPEWGPTQRGGAYQPHQLELLTTLHHSLNKRPNFTDIIVRSDDTVSYGYQLGSTQAYYQQSCTSMAGLPTPADLMGTIPSKAKRRLERDHNIVLL